ncbi:MAG: tetratricopeptide repeat protein [Flavobacteriales bacterium]
MVLIGHSAGAQEPGRLKALYQRFETLFEEEAYVAVDRLIDSIATAPAESDDAIRISRIARARAERLKGRTHDAFRIIDSCDVSVAGVADIVRFMHAQEKARILKNLLLLDKALVEATQAYHFAQAFGLQREEVDVLSLQAEIERRQGRYDAALGRLLEAERIAKAHGLEPELCGVLNNRGSVLYYQQRYEEALSYFEQAMACAEQHGLADLVKRCISNIGSAKYYLEDEAAAIAFYRMALQRNEVSGDPSFAAETRASIGQMYNDLGLFDKAKAELDTALAMMVELGDSSAQADCYLFLSVTYSGAGKPTEALLAAERARSLAQAIGSVERLGESEHRLYEVFDAMGRCPEAMEHLRIHHEYLADLDSIKQGETIHRLEIAYGTEQKIQALALSQAQLQVSQDGEKAKRNQRNWLIGLSATLVLLAVVLFRNFNSQKRLRAQERVLHEGEVNDLLKQQEINSLDAMMKGQEHERQRVGKDLHDRVGSMLSAVKLQFSALEGRMENMETKQLEQYNRVFSLLDETVVEVRRISHDMVRGTLSQFGLVGALEDLRSAVHTPGKLNVTLSMFGMEERLEQNLEIAVYRMVQECVSNVMKHAQAAELSMQLTRTSAMLNILVEDDGRGFDPAGTVGGMGMANIRERAAAYKGSVNVDSRPGRGTTVSIDVPLTRLPEVG